MPTPTVRSTAEKKGLASERAVQEWSALDAQPLTVEFDGIAAAGAERLELWLPHRATVTILSLEVAAGAVVAPVKDLRPRWITHGSSITHCAEAHSPARTWPATAARLADVRLYSLGFGGQCHFDQAVARVITILFVPSHHPIVNQHLALPDTQSFTFVFFAPAKETPNSRTYVDQLLVPDSP